jgi:putative zinc finger/helix-turn-helix YgiT family protein
MKCPNGHENVAIRTINKKIHFRGVEIILPVEEYYCSACSVEFGTVEQTANVQRAIAEAYRRETGFLTGEEIVEKRKRHGWNQEDLAKRMNVGIASIKRWETGSIQSKSMDHALRSALSGLIVGDSCSGNRQISLPRIKLVLKEFESLLNRKLPASKGQLLYPGKYLWYADMVAFRECGQSITGATYARLPQGPQLNNYRELIQDILASDEKKAAPLSKEEKRIISRIARKFPKNQDIYNAVHRETVCIEKPPGAIIPYSDAERLTEI